MVRAKNQFAAALTVDGLWETLWSSRIQDFEHDPRLTEIPEVDREATRLRWVATATEELRKRGVGTPRQRRDSKEPFTFSRWILTGNGPFQAYAHHALIADREVRWLAVDNLGRVTITGTP